MSGLEEVSAKKKKDLAKVGSCDFAVEGWAFRMFFAELKGRLAAEIRMAKGRSDNTGWNSIVSR